MMEGAASADPRTHHRLVVLASLALIPLAVHMALAPGMTADEIVQRVYGDLILAHYRTGFGDVRALSYMNLYLYGGLFELPVQWLVSTGLSPWPVYESRHVLTALVGLLGVVATWLTVRRIAGVRAALLAALILLLTPAWVGHSLFNPKDIPFGAFAAFVMYGSVRIAMQPPPLRWRDAVCAALAVGCALGVRSGGMFLFAFPVAAVALRAVFGQRDGGERDEENRETGRRGDGEWLRGWQQSLRHAAIALARFACNVPLAWAVMLIAWPWAWQAPLTRPFEAAAIAADFDLSGKTRFDGKMVSFRHLPADYLPTWFLVTLPDLYALAAVCGVMWLIIRLRAGRRLDPARTSALALLFAFVALPVLGVLITRPTLYDAHRHFLFLLPGMAALAGLAFEFCLFRSELSAAVRGSLAACALLLGGVTLWDMYALHPYQYAYFNRASGGLARQATRFETDYWGASYREGFAWLVQHYDAGGTRKITVGSCAADKVLGYYKKQWNAQRFVLGARGEPEIFLSTTKRDCHKRPGEVIHTVERQGVPLLYVLRR